MLLGIEAPLNRSWQRFCFMNYRVMANIQVQVWLMLNHVGTYHIDDVLIDFETGARAPPRLPQPAV